MKSMFFCLMFISIDVMGQSSIDLATLSYRYGITQEMDNGMGRASENAGMINLKIPIQFSKFVWFSDLTYQKYLIQYTEELPGTIQPININAFIFQSGIVKKLNDRNAIQVLLVPRLMSDLTNLNAHHLQLGAIGLYEIKYNNDLTMRYGLMYNRELSGNLFVPLIYIDWHIDTKWSINATLPLSSKLIYQATDKLSFGFNHFGLITSYQVGDRDYSTDYIERISIDFNSFIRYRLRGNLFIEPRIGYAIGRSYYQYDTNDQLDFRVAIISVGDDRVPKNASFGDGVIVDFRLIYSIPIPKE